MRLSARAVLLILPLAACAPSASWRRHLSRGDRALHRGRHAEAEHLLAQALSEAERFGPADPRLAESLGLLGDLHLQRGEFAKAEALYRRALSALEASPRSAPPDLASAALALAEACAAQGRTAEAEKLYLRAAALDRDAASGDSPSREGLAALYRDQGRSAESEALYRQALLGAKKTFGPEHPMVAARLKDLALFYHSQENFSQAEPLYLQALDILEKNPRTPASELLWSLNNFALLQEAQGRPADAERFYKRALAAAKGLSPQDAGLLSTLSNYANLLRKTGREREAIELEGRLRQAPPGPRAKPEAP